MGCVLPGEGNRFFVPTIKRGEAVPGFAVAWIENYSPSQNRPSHNSNPVPNCLTAQKRQIRFSTPLGEVRSGIGENSPTFDEHCSIES